jgi:proteasome activator-like protein
MGSTEPFGPAGQPEREPEAEAVAPLRLAVVFDRPADASRVDAPDRVLRIWAMLRNADAELHQASLGPEMTARLQRQFDALTAELERSLSPALASELHHIIDRDEDTELTADELRVEYASLLAWTVGLVIEILTRLDAASAKINRPGHRGRDQTMTVTETGAVRATRPLDLVSLRPGT